MTQTALITGATGLLGRQVLKAFETAGYNVVGTGFSRASPPKTRKVDIQNEDEIRSLFSEVKYGTHHTSSLLTSQTTRSRTLYAETPQPRVANTSQVPQTDNPTHAQTTLKQRVSSM